MSSTKIVRASSFSGDDAVTFMCPECKKVVHLSNSHIRIEVEADTNVDVEIDGFTPYSLSRHLTVRCRSCYNDMVQIDNEIVGIIQVLNEKGYDTIYSCSGHLYGSVLPYVTIGYYLDEYINASDEDKQHIKDYIDHVKLNLSDAFERVDEYVRNFFDISDVDEHSITIRLSKSMYESNDYKKVREDWISFLYPILSCELDRIN